jgi:hypothetical protein
MSLILGLAVRHEAIRDNPVRHLDPIEAGYLPEYRARSVSLHYLRPVIALLTRGRTRKGSSRDAPVRFASMVDAAVPPVRDDGGER